MKNEPRIDDEKYEIHIKVDVADKGVRWYKWTSLDLAEVNYYAEGDGEKALAKDPSVLEFKVVKINKEVAKHFVR